MADIDFKTNKKQQVTQQFTSLLITHKKERNITLQGRGSPHGEGGTKLVNQKHTCTHTHHRALSLRNHNTSKSVAPPVEGAPPPPPQETRHPWEPGD